MYRFIQNRKATDGYTVEPLMKDIDGRKFARSWKIAVQPLGAKGEFANQSRNDYLLKMGVTSTFNRF